MSKLSTYLGKPAGQSPLPTFGLWNNNQSHMTIYDSDFTPIAMHGLTNTVQQSEAYSVYTTHLDTTTNVSTNSFTTGWVNSTRCNGFDGHHLLNTGLGDGGIPYNPNTTYAKSSIIRQYGAYATGQYAAPIIEHSGYKPTFNLYIANTTIGFMEHQSFYAPPQVTWYTPGTYCDATTMDGTVSSWGQGSYNVRTNTLVIMMSSNLGNQIQIHKWTNPNVILDPNKNNIVEFLSQAYLGTNGASYSLSPIYAWTHGAQTNNGSYYGNRVIALGNGKVALVRHGTNLSNSSGLYFSLFDPVSNFLTDIGTSDINTNIVYNVTQGAPYTTRMNFTWDNDWVAVYVPYSYYGAGMTALFIKINNFDSTTPPWYKLQYTQTSYGTQMVPIRESDFLINLTTFNPQLINLGGQTLYGRTNTGVEAPSADGSTISFAPTNSFPRMTTSRTALIGMNQWVDGSIRKYK